MNVIVNDKAVAWLQAQNPHDKAAFNTKCQEAGDNDLSTWRNVGGGLYDYRVSGNFRAVARKTGGNTPKQADTFTVLAIYRHATKGGKEWVAGDKVTDYGK